MAQDSLILGFYDGASAIGDIDGDGDQDLLISGFTKYNRRTFMYRNTARSGISIQELPFSEDYVFEVYPNPNVGTFKIRTDSKDPQLYRLYNLQGQLIDEFERSNESKHQLHLLHRRTGRMKIQKLEENLHALNLPERNASHRREAIIFGGSSCPSHARARCARTCKKNQELTPQAMVLEFP